MDSAGAREAEEGAADRRPCCRENRLHTNSMCASFKAWLCRNPAVIFVMIMMGGVIGLYIVTVQNGHDAGQIIPLMSNITRVMMNRGVGKMK